MANVKGEAPIIWRGIALRCVKKEQRTNPFHGGQWTHLKYRVKVRGVLLEVWTQSGGKWGAAIVVGSGRSAYDTEVCDHNTPRRALALAARSLDTDRLECLATIVKIERALAAVGKPVKKRKR
jgi:hypothetical protein